MYLRDKKSGDLVEILDIQSLTDPNRDNVPGRFHAGEELQDPAPFTKIGLEFPSGEPLPRCWRDAHYRG